MTQQVDAVTTPRREAPSEGGAVVRVLSGAGDVVGCGFLTAPGLVATSPHVVAAALGRPEVTTKAPAEPVRMDFPLLHQDGGVAGTVGSATIESVVWGTVERWQPELEDEGGGVALLRLAEAAPPGARMAPLRRIEPLAGRNVTVLGFPAAQPDGVWSRGVVRTRSGSSAYQLVPAPRERIIDAAFAGAPAWDPDGGAVVGMVGAPARRGPTRLLRIDQVVGFDPESVPCPYPGLRFFGEAQANAFFGRGADIERLLAAVRRTRVVTVVGASGVGKSSLVRAGLVPELRASGAEIVYVTEHSAPTLAQRVSATSDGADVVLVLDQFEDQVAVDPSAARGLLEQVVRLTELEGPSQVSAVLTARWSSLDELLTPELSAVLEPGVVLVGPLDAVQLRDAIVRPSELPPGHVFEDGLVERIVAEAGTSPGQLPLVESLLAELWERRLGGYLSMSDYEAVGGVAGALAQHAERVIGELPPEHRAVLSRLFAALARPDRDGRFVPRPMPIDQLPAVLRVVVPALISARLLVVDRTSTGVDVVGLAHQALIDHWPRLRDWLDQEHEFLTWRERVVKQRDQWEAEARPREGLLSGASLAAVDDWLPERQDELPFTSLEFVRRSTARQRWVLRRWRISAAVCTLLAVGAATFAGTTAWDGKRIADELAAANAAQLGRAAQARMSGDGGDQGDVAMAGQLALSAWREDQDSPEARSALASAFLATRSVELELPQVTEAGIGALSVHGDSAILTAGPGVTRVSGVSGSAPRAEQIVDIWADRQVALSPDGRWLANQTLDRAAIALRDLRGTDAPAILPRSGQAWQPVFGPRGERLAWLSVPAAGQPPELRIWDLRTQAEVPHRLGQLPGDTTEVWLTPDPNVVVLRQGAAGAPNGRLVLRSLADGAELGIRPPNAQVIRGGAALATCEPAPDGQAATLVATAIDGAAPIRVKALSGSCDFRFSAERNALVERYAEREQAKTALLRLTDLGSGRSFAVEAPSASVAGDGGDQRVAFRLAAAHPDDGADSQEPANSADTGEHAEVFLAHGSSLLRLRAEPWPAVEAAPVPDAWLGYSPTQRHQVLATPDGFAVVDSATGQQLAAAPGIRDNTTRSLVDGDALWHARPTDRGWELTRYELPTLRPLNTVVLPGRTPGRPSAGPDGRLAMTMLREPESDGGRLIALADGILSAWDGESNRPAGQPVPLGANDTETGFFRDFPTMASRPGHPGQVAVVGPRDVRLWDAASGRELATLPVVPNQNAIQRRQSPLAFDSEGRLAVLTEERTVELWDIDDARPLRPALPVPDAVGLLGFDADDNLVLRSGTGEEERVSFFDVSGEDGGGELGSLTSVRPVYQLSPDGETLRLWDPRSGVIVPVPATAQGWRDALCTHANRPLTPAEQALLPPGTSTEPACS